MVIVYEALLHVGTEREHAQKTEFFYKKIM